MSDLSVQILAAVIGGLVLLFATPLFTVLVKWVKKQSVRFFDSGSFLGMSGDLNTIYVDSYQTQILSRNPVSKIAGYIRSNITNDSAPLMISIKRNIVPLELQKGIPPNKKALLTAK